jgi:hypothetical protein
MTHVIKLLHITIFHSPTSISMVIILLSFYCHFIVKGFIHTSNVKHSGSSDPLF